MHIRKRIRKIHIEKRMIITICGISELNNILHEKDFEHIVCFLDPPHGSEATTTTKQHHKLLRSFTKNIHTIFCKDIRGSKNTSPDAPSFGTIDKLVKIANTICEGDHVLIHCTQGISRSTAGAMILLMTKGHTQEEAYTMVRKTRSVAHPNDRMLRLYETLSRSTVG